MPKTAPQTTRAFRNARGSIIGVLMEGGTFTKKVQKSKHFMRALNAWGMDEYVKAELEKENCQRIKIYDLENDHVWQTPFEVFKTKSFKQNFQTPQWFLETKWWNVSVKDGKVIQERQRTKEELEKLQPKLKL